MNESISTDVSLDLLFEMVADRDRRRLLVALHEIGRPERNGHPDSEVTIDPNALGLRKTTMVHVTLPKLERAGLIEWDRDRSAVSRGPRFEGVRPLLELLDSYEFGERQ
jgi:predicted transcriptional regulator